MPIYEYRCDCGEVFEKIVPFAEADNSQQCPKCEEEVTKVPFSLSHFHLKGKWFKNSKEY